MNLATLRLPYFGLSCSPIGVSRHFWAAAYVHIGASPNKLYLISIKDYSNTLLFTSQGTSGFLGSSLFHYKKHVYLVYLNYFFYILYFMFYLFLLFMIFIVIRTLFKI